MPGIISDHALKTEKIIADAISDSDVPRDEVLGLIRELPAFQQFVMKEAWVQLARDDSLATWRRLESYSLFINRCITYPCDLGYFLSEAITPLGIDQSQIVDMTKAQCIPVARKEGVVVRMANLPIPTPVGLAAVYFSVHRLANTVEQVAVYPESIEVNGILNKTSD